ncbi:MAG: hypothetical protein ACFBSG_12780 [Leptolyngbyaceae cyanobacterium]
MDILVSLASGLIIAAAVQLLLANLGLALGLTLLDWSPSSPQPAEQPKSSPVSLPLTPLVGLGVTLTVSLVLFVAALLATEFGQLLDPRRGVIFSILLWAVYWLVFLWLSSTAIANLTSSVFDVAITGGRRLLTALQQLASIGRDDSGADETATLQAIQAQLRDIEEVQQYLPQLLAEQRQTLIEEISDRTDLSSTEIDHMLQAVEPQVAAQPQTTSMSSSGSLLSQLNLPSWQDLLEKSVEQLDLSSLDAQSLWQLVKDWQPPDPKSPTAESSVEPPSMTQQVRAFVTTNPPWRLQPSQLQHQVEQVLSAPEVDTATAQQQLSELDHDQYVTWLQQRTDLDTDQITTIAAQLSSLHTTSAAPQATITTSGDQATTETAPPVPTAHWQAVEEGLLAYLRYTNLDSLSADSLSAKIQTLRNEADIPETAAIAPDVTDRSALGEVLSRRKGLALDHRQALAQVLETELTPSPRPANEAESAGSQLSDAATQLAERLAAIDWSTIAPDDLANTIINQARSLDLPVDFDWSSILEPLPLSPSSQPGLIDTLQSMGQALQSSKQAVTQVGQSMQTWTAEITQDLSQYLQFASKSALQPEAMTQALTDIWQRALQQLPDLSQLPNFSDLQQLLDLTAVQQALRQRPDLTAQEVEQIVDALQQIWQRVTQTISDWVGSWQQALQARLDQGTDNLATVRQQVVNRIVSAQETVQARAIAVQADLQRQADVARQQVAIAAWWLFLSLVSSGVTAAIAGWLATQY